MTRYQMGIVYLLLLVWLGQTSSACAQWRQNSWSTPARNNVSRSNYATSGNFNYNAWNNNNYAWPQRNGYPQQGTQYYRYRKGGETGAAFYLKEKDYDVSTLWTGPRNSKLIALTFDDGPHPEITPRVLEVLGKYGVKATFFMTGEMLKVYPDVGRKVVEAGMEIGNHSNTHPNLENLSDEKFWDQIDFTQNLIQRELNVEPMVMRPPYGLLGKEQAHQLQERRLYPVFWSRDTSDYEYPGVKSIISRATTGIGGGEVILFHDRINQTAEALPKVIEGLQTQGFQLVTVSEMIAAATGLLVEKAPLAAAPPPPEKLSTAVAEKPAPDKPPPYREADADNEPAAPAKQIAVLKPPAPRRINAPRNWSWQRSSGR